MTPETAYVQQKMQQMLHGSLHEKPGGEKLGERSGEDKQVNSHEKSNKILKPILGVSHKEEKWTRSAFIFFKRRDV